MLGLAQLGNFVGICWLILDEKYNDPTSGQTKVALLEIQCHC